MILIVGGAYQGKLEFGKALYPAVSWIDGSVCKEEDIYQCEGIFHFHDYVEGMLRRGKDVGRLAEQLKRKNPKISIISDDIGCGIVPAEPFERMYREAVGRILTELSADASEVYRVVCGIGMKIKG